MLSQEEYTTKVLDAISKTRGGDEEAKELLSSHMQAVIDKAPAVVLCAVSLGILAVIGKVDELLKENLRRN